MIKKIFITTLVFVMSFMTLVSTVFAQDTYKVTFSYSGTSKTIEVQAGETVDPIEIPGKEGYIFYRWKNNKTQDTYDFSQPVTENLILAAQWKKEKGVDMTELVAGDLDQSHITHVDPNKEFGLTKEKVKESVLDRFDIVSICLLSFGVILIIFFLIVYAREKRIQREIMEEMNHKKKEEGPTVCHKCGKEYSEKATECPNCGARLFK